MWGSGVGVSEAEPCFQFGALAVASFCSQALGGCWLTLSLTELYFWSVPAMFSDATLCLCAFSTQCKLGNGRTLGLHSSSHLANVYSVIKVTEVEKAPSTRSFQDGVENRWYSPCCDLSQQASCRGYLPYSLEHRKKTAGWRMKDAVAEGLATSSYVQCSAPCRCSIKSDRKSVV